MNKKVIVAGHICLDITPVFYEDKSYNQISDLLQPGQLIQMGKADVHTGGAVANTGLGMKKLGANVSLIGKVGKDAFGEMILSILRKYNADSGMVVVENESSSYSVILAIQGIDRIFLHNAGTNDTFSSDDVTEEALTGASLFHFGYPPLMKQMYQNDGEELEKLFIRAKKAGAITSMDMASVDPNSDSGKVDWIALLKRVLPHVDLFVPSVEELCFMIDPYRFQEWKKRAGDRDITDVLDWESDIRPLADTCLSWGTNVMLIKCGAPGLYLKTAEKDQFTVQFDKNADEVAGVLNPNVWSGLEIFEKSYAPDCVLSGTGAGDTSIAAFLTSILNEESPEMCMHLAAATGASCVTAYDALGGLKSLDELKKKISDGWNKVK
ncbi:MAG: carbohydrate kinase family protein [Clostridiales bacterium]|nr:carbohydrate kinase family protein [Clostridiales bacterium]